MDAPSTTEWVMTPAAVRAAFATAVQIDEDLAAQAAAKKAAKKPKSKKKKKGKGKKKQSKSSTVKDEL